MYATANKWFSKVSILTREWELSVDQIKRAFVVELFVCGHDALAVEVSYIVRRFHL